MSEYEYGDRTRLAIGEFGGGEVSIAVRNAADPPHTIHVRLPADQRQAAAAALAGDGYRVVPTDEHSRLARENDDLRKQLHDAEVQAARPEQPARHLLLDLWQALGCDPANFDDWHTRHGSPDTWGQLLAIVRRAFRPVCGKLLNDGSGERCVLTAPASEGDLHVCHGPSDVGTEELPPIPAVQTARPEPVDPADVRVGDVVEVEDEFGIWLIRGMVNAVDNGQLEIIHGSSRRVWVLVSGVNVHATVRLLRRAEPQPDPDQVEALYEAIYLTAEGQRQVGLNQDGRADEYRAIAEGLVRRGWVRRGVVVRDEH